MDSNLSRLQVTKFPARFYDLDVGPVGAHMRPSLPARVGVQYRQFVNTLRQNLAGCGGLRILFGEGEYYAFHGFVIYFCSEHARCCWFTLLGG